jgi:hypothetical protein
MSPDTLPPVAAAKSSRLLTLQGEIRNWILGFALTSADGSLNFTTKTEPEVSNQLQYMCKQLHHECHWLNLKHNPAILFQSYKNDALTATQLFLSFIAKVPSEKRQWIATVEPQSHISEHYGPSRRTSLMQDSKHTLFHLADVCRYNRGITKKI